MATKRDLALLHGEIAEMREATKQDLVDLREEMSARFATGSEVESTVSGQEERDHGGDRQDQIREGD
jgi:hypothetical protein